MCASRRLDRRTSNSAYSQSDRLLTNLNQHSGIRPSLSLDIRLAPFSTSSRTTASCPFSAAHHSGVRPLLSLNSRLAPFLISSRTTTTHHSGVRPLLSLDSRLA